MLNRNNLTLSALSNRLNLGTRSLVLTTGVNNGGTALRIPSHPSRRYARIHGGVFCSLYSRRGRRSSANYRPGIDEFCMLQGMWRFVETGHRRRVPDPVPIVAGVAKPPIGQRCRIRITPAFSIPTIRFHQAHSRPQATAQPELEGSRQGRRGMGRKSNGGETGCTSSHRRVASRSSWNKGRLRELSTARRGS